MSSASTTLRSVLASAGCRMTLPRRAVLEAFRTEHEHLEPDEILHRARKGHPSLGRATVYRALDLMTEVGLLRPLRGRSGRTSFMRIGRGHDHLVCSRCDKVSEVRIAEVHRLGKQLARRAGFVLQSHLLEFYGICRSCRSKVAS